MAGTGAALNGRNKRAVKDKYMGPLVSHDRDPLHPLHPLHPFRDQVAGVPELGATGRGENMEVGTYIEKALTSELSAMWSIFARWAR